MARVRAVHQDRGEVEPEREEAETTVDEQREEDQGTKRRSRRFVRRNRWRRKKKALKKRRCKESQPDLFSNFSDHILTEDQKALLNKGPNFCPTRDSVNKTEVKVSNFSWGRKMLWRQVFHG